MNETTIIEEVAADLHKAQRIIAFTGAGVSEESGIPTYRDKGGLWTKYDPNKYASIDGFENDPSYYWNFFKDSRKPILENAKPNPAHIALAKLEEMDKLKWVITQNIDGLHHAAGSKNVIELHGTTRTFRCKDCNKQYTLESVNKRIETELPPLCDECVGVIRPNVIFFGEMLPSDAINLAFLEAEKADFVIAIGSSLIVYPAAQVPIIAKQAGAKLFVLNTEPVEMDAYADYVIYGKAGEIMPKILEKMEEGG